MPYLEDYIPVVKYHGLSIGDSSGTTATGATLTLNKTAGVITTASLSTGSVTYYTFTLTNSKVENGDMVLASLRSGSCSTGTPVLTTVSGASGSVVFKIWNMSDIKALNGTLLLNFLVIKGTSDKTF